MTHETTRDEGAASADPAELQQRLAQAEERLSFYTSFDKLIQDNIARSGELMRDALALREQANADIRSARAESERVQDEAAQAVAVATAEAVEERRRFSETLLALHEELGSLQDAAAGIGRRVGTVLGELGAGEFVPVGWATPAVDTAESDAAAPAPEAAGGETADAEVWNPLAEPGDESSPAGDLIAYKGTGTGELSLEGAGDDTQVAEFFPSPWDTEVAAYPEVDLEIAEEAAALEAEALPESEPEIIAEAPEAAAQLAEPETALASTELDEDDFASLEDFEAAIAALEADETGNAALPAELDQIAEAVSADDAEPSGADDHPAVEADAEPAVAEAAVAYFDDTPPAAEAEPTIPGPDDVDVYAAAAYEMPVSYREEGFLGGYAPEMDQEDVLAAEADFERAVAVETVDEPRSVMVLVHGVPRAAAALSLQRHLAGLGHVEGVEAREYAEGILRLHVTARVPLALDDLRAWDGGADLEPVHVQDDVIEVRLPGAIGF